MLSVREAKIRKVVLLGATGRLGQMLRIYWPRPELLSVGRSSAPGVHPCDILKNPAALRELMGSHAGPVVCLAGVTPMSASAGADMADNTSLALATLQAAHDTGAGRVFLASSAAVYGRQSGLLTEETPLMPLSDYAEAKVEMEVRARALAAQLNHPMTVLRIGNVAGADAILGGWHDQMRLDVFPDGRTPRRSYVGPSDLALMIAGLATTVSLPPVLNIAAKGAVAMGALLDTANLPWHSRPAPETAIPEVELSTKQLSDYVDVPEASAEGLVAAWRDYEAKIA